MVRCQWFVCHSHFIAKIQFFPFPLPQINQEPLLERYHPKGPLASSHHCPCPSRPNCQSHLSKTQKRLRLTPVHTVLGSPAAYRSRPLFPSTASEPSQPSPLTSVASFTIADSLLLHSTLYPKSVVWTHIHSPFSASCFMPPSASLCCKGPLPAVYLWKSYSSCWKAA